MIHTGRFLSAAFLILLGCLTGCAGIGPGTVARDRFDYTKAISDSWKDQMLLNMVKIRYGDAPVFLDVVSVINQYQLEGNVSLNAAGFSNPFSTEQSVAALGRYTDRPTITYTPLMGEKFTRSLMTSIPPTAILSLIQAGYPVGLVFRTLVHSINGIQNRYGGDARFRVADPEFYPLLEKMRRIQSLGAIGMRLQKVNEKETSMLIFRVKKDEKMEIIERDIADIRKTLGLSADINEFKVVYGSVPSDDKEIAILSRSILEIIIDLASSIEVPAVHVTENRVNPTLIDTSTQGTIVAPLMRIQSSKEKPSDAFVSIPFRGHWFWIDDKDLPSKRLFSFLMFVFTLVETEEKGEAPIVTISTGD